MTLFTEILRFFFPDLLGWGIANVLRFLPCGENEAFNVVYTSMRWF